MKILFVCLGNICRSPAAEGVVASLLPTYKLESSVALDSAGTCDHHIGQKPDARMRHHALKRGIKLDMLARQFDATSDFKKFDMIIVMDDSNKEDILKLDKKNEYQNKVYKMTDFSEKFDFDEVPDPYFGGDDGFELVLDLVTDAGNGLLRKIKNDSIK